jgi:hypothetical protein
MVKVFTTNFSPLGAEDVIWEGGGKNSINKEIESIY